MRKREREREREREGEREICTTGTGKRAWPGQINYICLVQTPHEL